MKSLLFLLLASACTFALQARDAGPDTLRRSEAVREALRGNPEIEAALQQMFVMDARVPQASSLPPPEFLVMREGMPNFRYGDAMFARYELMQMIPFPTRLSTKRAVAETVAEHAHHDHLEKVSDVVARVKTVFGELWYVQQAIALTVRNALLAEQFAAVARTRYGAGGGGIEEVLKAEVEAARQANALEVFRHKERGTKSMLMALLARRDGDTLGVAVLPDTLAPLPAADTLAAAALRIRPMLLHDSLGVTEWMAMRSLARQEYLPDFKIGLQYVTSPINGFHGWTVTAGITLPFAPWVLGNASGKVEEAEAGIGKARATLQSSRAMVSAAVRELSGKAAGERSRLELYRSSIIPRARQALDAGIAGYQTGTMNFLMLLDSYRMLVELSLESIMIRMEYEQTIARLEREIGTLDLSRFVPAQGVTR
jgi:outer membrane protein TolC